MLTNTRNIKINPNLPLLICDADEVIFEFMNTFENFLRSNNLYFSYESFKLNGNIKEIKNNKALENNKISLLIDNFFKKHTYTQKLIKDSKITLEELSKQIGIVILTNMPNKYVINRVKALENNGMFYDVIANKGGKGQICAELEKKTDNSVFFIDDSPNQIASVAYKTKNIFKIHFLQNPKLLKILPQVNESDYNTHDWREIKEIILSNI